MRPSTSGAGDDTGPAPLKPVDFLVLMVLSAGARHGYGIVRDIADQTRDGVRLVPGNLYSVLRRLLDQGLISECDRRPAADLDDARRRYYELTESGREALAVEALRMRELVTMAEVREIISPPPGLRSS